MRVRNASVGGPAERDHIALATVNIVEREVVKNVEASARPESRLTGAKLQHAAVTVLYRAQTGHQPLILPTYGLIRDGECIVHITYALNDRTKHRQPTGAILPKAQLTIHRIHVHLVSDKMPSPGGFVDERMANARLLHHPLPLHFLLPQSHSTPRRKVTELIHE